MLKELLENIKWYDKLYYQNQKVIFFHKENYKQWIKDKVKNHSERRIVNYFIKQNKLDKIINKAINDETIINCESNNLCITCLQSRIKILFNKEKLLLVTVIHGQGDFDDCERKVVNAEYIGLRYNFPIKQGWYNGVIVENYIESSYVTFFCDECFLLDL